mgnify:FL=1
MPDDSWLVLADFESLFASEPVFDGSQEVEVFPPIRAKYAGFIPRGNVPRIISFARIYEFTTANAARDFEIEHMTLLDGMVRSEFSTGIKDGDSWLYDPAMLTGQPREKDTKSLPPTSVVFDYNIYVGVPTKQASAMAFDTWENTGLEWELA